MNIMSFKLNTPNAQILGHHEPQNVLKPFRTSCDCVPTPHTTRENVHIIRMLCGKYVHMSSSMSFNLVQVIPFSCARHRYAIESFSFVPHPCNPSPTAASVAAVVRRSPPSHRATANHESQTPNNWLIRSRTRAAQYRFLLFVFVCVCGCIHFNFVSNQSDGAAPRQTHTHIHIETLSHPHILSGTHRAGILMGTRIA